MIVTDLHTHTAFSADGKSDIKDMIETAIAKGVTYYGICEHVNYDYAALGIEIEGETDREIDLHAYFSRARALQEEYKSKIELLIGCELGYNGGKFCREEYGKIVKDYKPDFVVNSVHTCLGEECYFPHYTQVRSKKHAYSAYFDAVYESLEAPYPYDIVAHIGYCSRNAVYADPKIRYAKFAETLDKILVKIIKKGKILEVNASAKTAGSPFLPDVDILKRYYELGGRNVSYGSDAHDTARVTEKRDTVVKALKQIGFTYITVPVCGEYIKIEI